MTDRKKDNKKHGVLWKLRWLFLFLAEIALIVSIFKITKYKRETAASQAASEELAQAVTVNAQADFSGDGAVTAKKKSSDDGLDAITVLEESTEDPDVFPITVDFDMLLKKNPDCVAWLYSKGTPINHAVLQADDNTYYLYRTFDRVRNGYGTIFLDCNGSAGINDANNLIFGHNMQNETMFGSLKHYRDKGYLEEHPYLWLVTQYKKFRLEVVAGIVHTDESTIYSTPISRKATDELVPSAINSSVFETDAVYDPDANYVTLSTCCNDFAGARLAIICKMVEMK